MGAIVKFNTADLTQVHAGVADSKMSAKHDVPGKIRVSVGSAIMLELMRGKLDADPTTVYMLTYREEKCAANCGFCPQARTSKGRADLLSRVTWPAFSTLQVINKIAFAAKKGKVVRVCIQALNYPTVFEDILSLAEEIRARTDVALSVSCQPLTCEQMKMLARTGIDRISIALDAATEELFNNIKGSSVKGPYTWKQQRKALKEAVQVFGKGSVSTHLIVGLGESERDVIKTIQWCTDLGICPSLFAFTPISGTALEKHVQPPLSSYRRVQIARFLIVHGKTRYENMEFDEKGEVVDFGVSIRQIERSVEDGAPFRTSGCPGCNRPYYNERPGGPIYNYPCQPTPEEVDKIASQLEKENNWTFGI